MTHTTADVPVQLLSSPARGTVPIHLVAWGATESDVERAISEASLGWGRQTWDIVAVERHIGVPCPIDVEDRWAIAADRHYDWAYLARRVDR